MYKLHIRFMEKNYTLVIEKGEDGWLVSEVVELPGCHTQAKTMDQLIERTKDAIEGYLESLKKHNEPIPPPIIKDP